MRPRSWRSSRADPPRTPRSPLGSVARLWRGVLGDWRVCRSTKSFWLAASAAVPVITLATVVAIPDAANMRFRAGEAMWAGRGSAGDLRDLGPRERAKLRHGPRPDRPVADGHPMGGPGDQTERAAVLREPDRLGGAPGCLARGSRVRPGPGASVAGDSRRGWRCGAPRLDPAPGSRDARQGGTDHPPGSPQRRVAGPGPGRCRGRGPGRDRVGSGIAHFSVDAIIHMGPARLPSRPKQNARHAVGRCAHTSP
jgi:hypothetical protein